MFAEATGLSQWRASTGSNLFASVFNQEITIKTLILAAIRCSLMFLVTGSLFSVQPAQAFTMTVTQNGANVVWTGSGAFNLTGLTQGTGGLAGPSVINASIGEIAIHSGDTLDKIYSGFTRPGRRTSNDVQRMREIVGVVGNMKHGALDGPTAAAV
jgi:hypothetical protein